MQSTSFARLSRSAFLTRCLFVLFILSTWLSSCLCKSNCRTIKKCLPDIMTLDHMHLNKSVTIKCQFHHLIKDPLDIIWMFQMENTKRVLYDDEGNTMPPFKHEIVDVDTHDPANAYSISILEVPLLNSSYFTNYTISSVSGGCHRTVHIQLEERSSRLIGASPVHYPNALALLALSLLTLLITSRT